MKRLLNKAGDSSKGHAQAERGKSLFCLFHCVVDSGWAWLGSVTVCLWNCSSGRKVVGSSGVPLGVEVLLCFIQHSLTERDGSSFGS